jgi:hypothetical protein
MLPSTDWPAHKTTISSADFAALVGALFATIKTAI